VAVTLGFWDDRDTVRLDVADEIGCAGRIA
jgi:hypothetical protein